MSIVRRAAVLAVSAAIGVAVVPPAQAFHICVTAPDAPEVCICTRPTDHNCGHGKR